MTEGLWPRMEGMGNMDYGEKDEGALCPQTVRCHLSLYHFPGTTDLLILTPFKPETSR